MADNDTPATPVMTTEDCFPDIKASEQNSYEGRHDYKTFEATLPSVPTDCPKPTEEDYAVAYGEAVKKLIVFAKKYCATGNESCSDPKKCQQVVNGIEPLKREQRSEDTYTSPTGANVKPGAQTNGDKVIRTCFVVVKLSGHVWCRCKG